MKVLGSIYAGAILLLSLPAWAIATNLGGGDALAIAQNSVETSTETSNGEGSTSVSFNRADLRKPHVLRVYGMLDNTLVPMDRVEVKLNGKVVKTIANGSLELDLAPLMTAGRYEVDVSGTSPKSDATISLNFTGTHVNVSQQSSGTGKIDRKLIIEVRRSI